METTFNEIVKGLKENLETLPHTHVSGKFEQRFCPYIQFVRVDFLDEKDWPHNIAQNSVYITFEIDLQSKKVKVFDNGHIYLTKADMDNSYLCMAGLKTICQTLGGKWLRTFSYKDSKAVIKKLTDFSNSTLKHVQTYTNNVYPYKEGVIDIYPPRAKKVG